MSTDAATALLPGDSPAWVRLRTSIERVAACNLPVLIHGESGSGKEGVARTLHSTSPRARGPFVAINCAALSETLLEAELFGALRGAYTGCDRDRDGLLRQASGGTLLLDEVGEMSGALQGKLLRFLDSGTMRPVGSAREIKCDVRILAATHRDLRAAVVAGSFRDDLWWRISVLRVAVPPLRRRIGDLPQIVRALAPALERECARGPLTITAAAHARLSSHGWPGNVRELRGVLARALLASDGAPLEAQALQFDTAVADGALAPASLEERMIREALEATVGGISAAALRIGWTRQKLYRRMSALKIHVPTRRQSRLELTTSSSSSTFQ